MYINMVLNRDPCFGESVLVFIEVLNSSCIKKRLIILGS